MALIRYTPGDTLATGPHGTMHNQVADMLEDGIPYFLSVAADLNAGSSYSGGNNSKGNRIVATCAATITTMKFRLTAVSGRTYKARLFQESGANLGTQIGSTLSVVGTVSAAELLTFTATDWVLAAGLRYVILVFDDTGAAVTGYYQSDPDTLGGVVCWKHGNSSAYADATPVATEATTSDGDIYMMSIEGTFTFVIP